jgi:ParB/RepB/Spo0J family partition protein
MSIANAPRKTKTPKVAAVLAAAPAAAVESRMIAIDHVVASAENPRSKFDDEPLAELGRSLRDEGQLVPLVVRRLPGTAERYELIDGERRWRAAKLVGLASLRADVRECSESEAAMLRLVSFQRADLSPIEEARGFQLLVEKYAVSQRELAAKLQCSQGHIGNRLRLLKLPDAWQAKVISGEITATDARQLATFADLPAVLAELESNLEFNDENFRDALVSALWEVSEPVEGNRYVPGVSQGVSIKFTEAELDELDVRETPPQWANQQPQNRCYNTELWQQLMEPKIERARNKEAKSGNKSSGDAGDGKAAKAGKTDTQKTKELKSRVAKWKLNWQRDLVAEWFEHDASAEQVVGFLLLALWGSPGRVRDSIAAALTPLKKVATNIPCEKLTPVLVETAGNPGRLKAIAKALWSEGDICPWRFITPNLIEHLFEVSACNLSDKWIQMATRPHGDFVAGFLKLFNQVALEQLNKEWKLSAVGATRGALEADMISRLQAKPERNTLPKIVASVGSKDALNW